MMTHPLDAHGRPVHLTPRQHEILLLLRAGLRPAAVAERLGWTVAAVRREIGQVNACLQTHSYHTSLLLAERLGLLDG